MELKDDWICVVGDSETPEAKEDGCCRGDVPEDLCWKCLVLSRFESVRRNSTLEFDEEESVGDEDIWLAGRGRRTGFGGSLLTSAGFLTGLFLLSGPTSASAAASGNRLAGETILDSVLGRLSPP